MRGPSDLNCLLRRATPSTEPQYKRHARRCGYLSNIATTPPTTADGLAVALQQPVGDRTIVDDRTGAGLPVRPPVQVVPEGS